MGSPKRIQRKRSRGWRMPEGAVIVSRPTKWGNPFKVGGEYLSPRYLDPGWIDLKHPTMVVYPFNETQYRIDLVQRTVRCVSREQAILWYRTTRSDWYWRDARKALAGKDLACWCPLPAPGETDVCHAAVLLRIANGGEP